MIGSSESNLRFHLNFMFWLFVEIGAFKDRKQSKIRVNPSRHLDSDFLAFRKRVGFSIGSQRSQARGSKMTSGVQSSSWVLCDFNKVLMTA